MHLVFVLISLLYDTRLIEPHDINLIFLDMGPTCRDQCANNSILGNQIKKINLTFYPTFSKVERHNLVTILV